VAGRPRDDDGYSLGKSASSEVARKIRTLLEKRKLTQLALATKTGIPASHLSDLLSDHARRRFQRWQIVALAEALGASERQLLPEDIPHQIAPRDGAARKMSDPHGKVVPPNLEALLDRHADRISLAEAKRIYTVATKVEHPGVVLSEAEWEGIVSAVLGRPIAQGSGRSGRG
jgi:transcriptional regulator with XRE-family HTH domain